MPIVILRLADCTPDRDERSGAWGTSICTAEWACDTAAVSWPDRIFALVVVGVVLVGGGMIRRHRGRQGYVRYSLGWISVWIVSMLVLIALWLVVSRQVIH